MQTIRYYLGSCRKIRCLPFQAESLAKKHISARGRSSHRMARAVGLTVILEITGNTHNVTVKTRMQIVDHGRTANYKKVPSQVPLRIRMPINHYNIDEKLTRAHLEAVRGFWHVRTPTSGNEGPRMGGIWATHGSGPNFSGVRVPTAHLSHQTGIP